MESIIDRQPSKLNELSALPVFSEKDYRGIHDVIFERLNESSLFGRLAIWRSDDTTWIPELQAYPPGTKRLFVPEEWNGQRIGFASNVGDEMLPEIWVMKNFLPKK